MTILITEVQQYIKGLFRSLKVVHDHHIIHRDIKPSNFLYNSKNGTFRLIDFGLAHFQNEYSGTNVVSEDLLTRPSLELARKKTTSVLLELSKTGMFVTTVH